MVSSREGDVRAFLAAALARIYSPRTTLNAWQWGEKEIVLGSKESIDFQGRWDSGLTPYVRFMMGFVTGDFGADVEFHEDTPADAEWREFIVQKSSQLGFTLAYLILLCYWVAEVKQNALFAIDSLDEARRISKNRLQPMLQACKPTAAALEEASDEQSNLTLYLLALTVYLLGSYGKGAFRNKSVGLAILDELDAYKVDDEIHPLDAARNRLKAVTNGKLIAGGAPETEEHLTAKTEKTGTQHRYFVPCPHCEHMQQLVWERVRFGHCKDLSGEYDLNKVLADTYYECELCHQRIDETSKPGMVAKGVWRQTNPKPQPRRLSIKISDLYSPFSEARWGVIAVEFIAAQGNPIALASWNKNRMAEASRLMQDQRTPDHIEKLKGLYLRGTIPVEPCLVTVTVDVQADVKKWVKCGFLPSGEMWVIDWGATLSFDELLEIAADPVPVGRVPIRLGQQRWTPVDGWDGMTVHAAIGLIDEGHIMPEVRAFCHRSGGLFFPCKGRGGIQVRHTVSESIGDTAGEPIRVYHFSDDDIKKLLYIARISRRVKPVPKLEPGPRIWFPHLLDPEFKGELCSESLVTEKKGGLTREQWVHDKKKGPNDWGDALKEALVIWFLLESAFVDWEPTLGVDAGGSEI